MKTREVLDARADAVSRMTAFKESLPACTILEGDCREWLKQIPDGAIDLVITDPPYNMAYQSNRRQNGRKLPKIHNDNLDKVAWTNLMYQIARECRRVLRDDGHAYVFCNAQDQGMMLSIWGGTGPFRCEREIAYVKGVGTGSHNGFRSGWEKILFLRPLSPALSPTPNPGPSLIGYGGRERQRLKGHPSDAIWVGRTVKTHQIYPAQKDLVALAEMIKWSSDEGDVVLDCFAGSGSTGAAALSEGRKVILIESNKAAAELCRKRMGIYTENVKFEI